MIERVSEVRSAGHGGSEQPGRPAAARHPRPPALARPLGDAHRRVHEPARRQHRGRRAAVDAREPRSLARRDPVGGLGLRADVRARARAGGAAGRRRRAAADVPRRARRVRGVQRGGRGGAERGHAGRGPPRAGRRRRGAGAAELGADPAALPRRGTGPGVRLLRRHGRDLHGGGAGARRRHPRAGRGPRRMAVDLLRQRAHRARRPRARRAAASARETGSARAHRRRGGRAARRRRARPDAAAHPGRVGRAGAAVVAVRGGRRAARGLRAGGSDGWCAAAGTRCWTRG